MKHKSTNKPAIPFHPLIDEQPVDTLAHIQTMLRFAQESATKATVDTALTPHQIRVYSKLNGLLRMINEAVEYENANCMSNQIEIPKCNLFSAY